MLGAEFARGLGDQAPGTHAEGVPRFARRWHRVLGALLLLPLAATAVTGMLYKAGQAWLGIPEDTARLLMTVHEGAWLGRDLKVYYSLVLGAELLGLGFLGLALVFRKRPRRA